MEINLTEIFHTIESITEVPSRDFRDKCWKNGQKTAKKHWKNGQNVVILHWKNGQIMLNRKIDNYLERFYKNNSKALLVTGARQTGKSFSIRHFGTTHYESLIEINFIEKAFVASHHLFC